jgi:translation initiation factor IF-2
VHVTLTALRLGHAEALDDVDFLVVDTRPHAPAAWSLKALEWNVPARPVAGSVAGSVAGFGGGGTDRDRSDGDRPRRAAAGLGPAHRTCLRPAGPAAARRAAAGVPGGGAVGGVGGGARGGVWQHGR